MAHLPEIPTDGPHIEPVAHETNQTPLTVWLSMLAGGGMVLVIIGFIVGVIDQNAGSTAGILIVTGAAAFIAGSAAWLGVVRPFENFDDINQPMYFGHDHDEHDVHDEEPGEVHVDEPIAAHQAYKVDDDLAPGEVARTPHTDAH